MRSIVIIAIFCICFFQDVFCQNPPETIDIGKDFAKIERYNEYIYNANKNHYAAGKGRWNNFFKYTLGIGAMGGGAYLIYDGAQNDQVWTYPVGGGLIGFGFTYTIFNTSSVKWYKNYERDYIASARGLFGYIK